MSDGSASDGSLEGESVEEESASGEEESDSGEDPEELASRKARLEAAKRRYRATLRNEAEAGGGGFTEDHYRSQKPPHW